MNIIGIDSIIFGVDNVDDCANYLIDYGLRGGNLSEEGGVFSALDNTSIEICHKDNPSLPPVLQSGNTFRKVVYGVDNQSSLDAIAEELRKDREVSIADGVVESTDDGGFNIAFQITTRKEIQLEKEKINSPGAAPERPANELGTHEGQKALPRALSHLVLFVSDYKKAEDFYVNRLNYKITDTFAGVGSFLKSNANDDHHSLFFIQTPMSSMHGCEHFAFHLAGPSELMLAGTRFKNKGYQSFWGPGKHIFGSNWFWYFNSPMGCHVEYDADMDKHDDSWVPRESPIGADMSQYFLFENVEKWMPGGDAKK